MVKSKHITSSQKTSIMLNEAHGKLILLSIGIDSYDSFSGFNSLKTCSNDAMSVRDTLLDVHQLNADPNRLFVLCSKTSPPPSKGEIIKEIKKITNFAEENDRLMIFYSGHGHRINDDLYLVPQDAYDSEEPDALLDFQRVLDLVSESDAKQKIIILDACLSGPKFEGKKLLPAKYSKKFLADYLKNTKGTVVLSSSTGDQSSFSQSPNPKLSLFTHYFLLGLQGDPAALDDHYLTLSSLYDFVSTKVKRRAKSYQEKQFPSIDVKANGVMILGNFSQALISPESLDLDGYPVTSLAFYENESLHVDEVLTNIRRWTYSQEYLEGLVNDQLGEYLEEDFGSKASALIVDLEFPPDQVGVEGNHISFPAGEYYAEYIAEDKKYGKVVYTLSLDSDWFEQPEDIVSIASALNLDPNSMSVELVKSIEPTKLIPGLKARSWKITSVLNHKVEAKAGSYSIIIQSSEITFKGFVPSELFGNNSDKNASAIAANVLALLLG